MKVPLSLKVLHKSNFPSVKPNEDANSDGKSCSVTVPKDENTSDSQSKMEVKSGENATDENQILFHKEQLMKNWENWTKNIFSKIFFSEEGGSDLQNLWLIYDEIYMRRKDLGEEFVKLVIEAGIIEVSVIKQSNFFRL